MPYKRLILAAALALWLYAALPHTAALLFELYHLTGLGFLYWGYSGVKAASYYFGNWQYHGLSCVVLGLLVALPALLRLAWRGRERAA